MSATDPKPRTWKIPSRKGALPAPPKRKSRDRDDTVHELLAQLALILLPLGFTPRHFAELAKFSFVEAAAQICRFHNGKVNQSRVAVMTGLTRSDVKRLLTNTPSERMSESVRQTRSERVISGWVSHKLFCDTRGKPLRLPIKGGPRSFESLVRKFGGDVPPRAVLEELLRIRAVRQVHGKVELDLARTLRQIRASSTLTQLAAVVADAARLTVDADLAGTPVPVFRLPLNARNQLELAVLRRRAAESIKLLFDGLRASLQYRGTSTRLAENKHTLTISALVTERAPHQKQSMIGKKNR